MLVVGLMSGTSLDGIDACLVEIHGVGRNLAYDVRHAETLPWPAGLRDRVAKLVGVHAIHVAEAATLDIALGEAYAAAVITCCARAGVALSALDLVGSHGQTIYHAPAGDEPVSLQLGDPAVIAARTGVTTVARFRALDVALGGQGAPLVPYVDRLLYAHREGPLAAQNMGGIGNVTYLAPEDGPVLAFDTGPGNMVIDELVRRLTNGARRYDANGELARAGRVDEAIVQAWLARDPFLAGVPPKSTGREHYTEAFAAELEASCRAAGLADADVIATATAWTAATVADQYRRFLPTFPREVIVSGGGAANPALMAELARRLAPARVITSAEAGVDPDSKEALAFALLAYQAVMGEPNVETAATGAREAGVLGQIVPGRNFARALLKTAAKPSATAMTEAVNPDSQGLDALATEAMVAVMHAQDFQAVLAVDAARPAIAATIDTIAARLSRGGRLFYVGAGTSGRLGVLDASECPPTFSTPPEWVQGIIAGGDRALREAVEGAEDDRAAGAADLAARGLGPDDVVVGISANGGAPYVQGALALGRERGAATAIVTCNPPRPDAVQPDHVIVLPVGPEILSGSTRLKAGTATKLVLNMLSTLAMVRLGKVHDNLMVDLTISNRKLLGRATRLVARLTGLDEAAAGRLLDAAGGRVKRAVVMHHARTNADGADALLARSRGFLRPWLAAPVVATPSARADS